MADLRSRWLGLRRPRSKGVRRRLDVIRCDRDRMAVHIGGLPEAEPAVWQRFELGLAAIAAYQWDQALGHFQNAHAEASGAQLVPLCNQIGVCHYGQGRPDDALADFEESARLAKQYGDERGMAPAFGNIGVIRHEYGELGSALDHLSEALAIARKFGDQAAAALYLGNIGNVHRDRGELDEALKLHQDALAISHGIADQPGVASYLRNIGSVYRNQGKLGKAMRYYEEALAISRQTGDRSGSASDLGNIGGIHRYRGELDEALMFYEDAFELECKIGRQAGVATELANIGFILAFKGLYQQAVLTFAESLAILLATGVAPGPRQALFGLSLCDDQLGRGRTQELLKEAGLPDASTADLLDRIDQMRLSRPQQVSGRRVPFALRRLMAGAG